MSDLIKQLREEDHHHGEGFGEYVERLRSQGKKAADLIEADDKEIGSYRDGTGLRGVVRQQDNLIHELLQCFRLCKAQVKGDGIIVDDPQMLAAVERVETLLNEEGA